MEADQTPNLTNGQKDQVINVLIRDLELLKKKVTEIENAKARNDYQLPDEVLEENGILQSTSRLKRGRGARPLLESEIKEAQEKYETATACSRYLGVNYKTYKRWAKKYGLFKIAPWGKGSLKRYWAPDKGKYPLNQILEGKFPEYPLYRLKDLLIRSSMKKAECERCGMDERRITDGKMALLLNCKDGNEGNHILDNLELVCYNCMFYSGRGTLRGGRTQFYYNDPDRLQGASRIIEARF
jgi:hypothetical protein